ncbi:MAG: enoyl-CoA hydratase/isomerase family protein [Thermodesulfobacteriota bacterium]
MLLFQEKKHFLTIAINRPEALNTLTPDLIKQLTTAITEWSQQPDIRVIVITGAGDRAFVGGVDVRSMKDLDPEGAEKFITNLHKCFLAIRESPQIIIASINGYALGGGLELAVSCDLRIASDRAQFGMPEVKVGIPSVIESALLPRLIGLGPAAELVYTGKMIDAQEAWRIGLVNKVVPHEELKAATQQMVREILQNAPQALIIQKRLIAQWMEQPLSRGIAAGIKAFKESYRTDEPREGMQAFLEKRKPSFAIEEG